MIEHDGFAQIMILILAGFVVVGVASVCSVLYEELKKWLKNKKAIQHIKLRHEYEEPYVFNRNLARERLAQYQEREEETKGFKKTSDMTMRQILEMMHIELDEVPLLTMLKTSNLKAISSVKK